MLRLKHNKPIRFLPIHSKRYVDRYGRFHDLPRGVVSKVRVGIFGITINSGGKLLVSYPPHALDIPGLPGGGREGIETHAQTLQREYFEETGPHFVIKEKPRPVYQHRILYYASDANEYWQYDQYFYLVNVHHPKIPASRWITPEGGHAKWMPLREFHRITAAHKPAMEYFLKWM